MTGAWWGCAAAPRLVVIRTVGSGSIGSSFLQLNFVLCGAYTCLNQHEVFAQDGAGCMPGTLHDGLLLNSLLHNSPLRNFVTPSDQKLEQIFESEKCIQCVGEEFQDELTWHILEE